LSGANKAANIGLYKIAGVSGITGCGCYFAWQQGNQPFSLESDWDILVLSVGLVLKK